MKVLFHISWPTQAFPKYSFIYIASHSPLFFWCFHRACVALHEQMCFWHSWKGEGEWLRLQVGIWGRKLARDHQTALKKQFQINEWFLSVCVSCGQGLLADPKSDFHGVFPHPPSVTVGLFKGGLWLVTAVALWWLGGFVGAEQSQGHALLFLQCCFSF